MKYENSSESEYWLGWFIDLALAAAIIAMVLALAGCAGTVTPHQVRDHGASFDGNARNSGFLGFDSDGRGIITPSARARYNSLAALYGKRLDPPVGFDDGLTPTGTNTFLIDAQHLVDFSTMNRWKRQGWEPPWTR